jgi:anaerobic selenocysteine-containing dehydrogenase
MAHRPLSGIPRREFLKRSAAGAAMLAGSEMLSGPVRSEEKTMASDNLKAKLLACLGGPWPEPCELRPIVRARKAIASSR